MDELSMPEVEFEMEPDEICLKCYSDEYKHTDYCVCKELEAHTRAYRVMLDLEGMKDCE